MSSSNGCAGGNGCAGAIAALADSDAYRHQVPKGPRRPRPIIAGTILHTQVEERRLHRLSDKRRVQPALGTPRLAPSRRCGEGPGGTAAAAFTRTDNVTDRPIDATVLAQTP